MPVVTVTSTAPAEPAGELHVIEVAVFAEQLPKAEVAPKETSVALVRPVPVMVTLVPPAVGPVLGLIDVTAGSVGPLEVTVTDQRGKGAR